MSWFFADKRGGNEDLEEFLKPVRDARGSSCSEKTGHMGVLIEISISSSIIYLFILSINHLG